jgi:DNA modification methylase
MIADLAEREGLRYDAESDEDRREQARKTLAERFIVPPFSVLDARQGYWQERKRAWIGLGIESELGRGQDYLALQGAPERQESYKTLGAIAPNEGGQNGILTSPGKYATSPGGSPRPAATLGKDGHTQRGDGKGRPLARTEGSSDPGDLHHKFSSRPPHGPNVKQNPDGSLAYQPTNQGDGQSGTSVFDPVLCELAYRWFCPPSAAILDPFAGGSVRGIVAHILNHHYTGIDLQPAQIAANITQAVNICPDNQPVWIVGDSRNLAELTTGEFDFIFSCPPYYDLELYSDDPQDLSNLGDYGTFLADYRAIIAACIDRLKDNRFACFVVGDIRDKRGFYRNFISDTIAAFQDAGAALYNEAILVTAVGSLPIRIGRQFQGYRKLGKTHQNVLVFYKGDPKAIKVFGEVEAGEVSA